MLAGICPIRQVFSYQRSFSERMLLKIVRKIEKGDWNAQPRRVLNFEDFREGHVLIDLGVGRWEDCGPSLQENM